MARTTVGGHFSKRALEPGAVQALLLAVVCALGMLAGFWYAGRCREDAGETLR